MTRDAVRFYERDDVGGGATRAVDNAELRADIVVTSRQATHDTGSKTIRIARVIRS